MAESHFRSLALAALIALGLGFGSSPAKAGADQGLFQSIIKNQMNAFAAGDAKTAFSFATRSLQQRFKTPEFFMEMVRQGYRPVFDAQNVVFGRSKETKYGPTQEVYLTGPKGKNWLALYSFEQQDDGSWKISGCYLTKSEGFAA